MRHIIIASIFGLGLTACGGGGGGKAELVKACVGDGETVSQCECMADTAEKELDPATFKKLVTMAREGEDGAQNMMEDLSPEEQGKFMAFAMKAAMTCGAS